MQLYAKIDPPTSNTPVPSPFSETTQAIGIDTATVFLHGLHTRDDAKKVESESGSWCAINTRKGLSISIHCSHGPDGCRWAAAGGPQIRATIAAAARELAPHIIGNITPAYLRNRIETARLSRLDVSWDLRAPMADVAVVAPKEKFCDARTVQYATSATRYWGKRAARTTGADGQRAYERPSAKEMRVYDKTQEMLDEHHKVISERITRIEIQLNSNRTIAQNVGYGTLREVIHSGTAQLRVRAVLDEVCVSVRGERASPLTAAQMRAIAEKPVFAKLARKIKGNARRKEKQSTAKTEHFPVQESLVLRAGGTGVNIPETHLSAYPPSVQDEILEHVERQEAEARQRQEDDAEARYQRWWLAIPEADRALIDAVIAGRVVNVSEAWDEALMVEAVSCAKADAAEDSFFNLIMDVCGPF
jgi:hypothetical protein